MNTFRSQLRKSRNLKKKKKRLGAAFKLFKIQFEIETDTEGVLCMDRAR